MYKSCSKIKVAELRKSLFKLLKGVEDGEVVVATSRGQPIAILIPWSEESEQEAREFTSPRSIGFKG